MQLIPMVKLPNSVPRIVPNPYFKEKIEHKHSIPPYSRRAEAYRPQHGKQTGKTFDSVDTLEGNK